MSGMRRDAEAELNLPPGFRFHPTDEELVVHYLCRKVAGQGLPVPIIAEVDLYRFDPWQLPDKALFGQKEWYFFTPRDRKYPNGMRPNRAAGMGYWKATGADKPITPKGCKRTVGIKKALVFYAGKAPRGTKTDWIMHEYRMADANRSPNKGSLRLDDWVLCRLYNKKNSWDKIQQVKEEMFYKDSGSSSILIPESDEENGDVLMPGYPPALSDRVQELSAGQTVGVQMNTTGEQENDEWFMDLKLEDLINSDMGSIHEDIYSQYFSFKASYNYNYKPF
ncbi:hypothetical protein Cni_G26824 [Canna indica]|uniref:NAC domain-containing protein n=1 Tax=Canna indica TaxID=4628 RepID=A0AAQ3QQV0_9LILI|nr:hypothetical protein Cni_G26824 [Canna indica]